MDLNILKYLAFVKTAFYGSFTRAAEHLNYSQSGVSRMVNDLERECGMPLLIRLRSGITLTAEGTALLPYAKALCREYENFSLQVMDLQGAQTGVIRIGTVSSIATHWLPNVIRFFRQDFPGIEYELLMGDYEDLTHWINNGQVDCAFMRIDPTSALEVIPLADDPLRVVLPVGHPLASRDFVSLKDLSNEPFLLVENNKSKADVSQLLEMYHMSADVFFKTWNDYAVLSMVESGLGVSILPELILRRIPFRVVIRPLQEDYPRKIGVVLPKGSYISPAMKHFLDYLKYREDGIE